MYNYLCEFANERSFFNEGEHLINSLMLFLEEPQNGKTYLGGSSQISILYDYFKS